MTATEFLKDITHAQSDFMAAKASGFYNHKTEVRILDPLMEKYGMTHDEALNCARNRMTMQEYLRILERRNR